MTVEERLDRLERLLCIQAIEEAFDDAKKPLPPDVDPAVADLERGNRANAAIRAAEQEALNRKSSRPIPSTTTTLDHG